MANYWQKICEIHKKDIEYLKELIQTKDKLIRDLEQERETYWKHSRGVWEFLRDQCYGPWKVVFKTTHPDGTVVETAQRVVKKIKRD